MGFESKFHTKPEQGSFMSRARAAIPFVQKTREA